MSNQPSTFPGSRVPVTNQVAGALESLSAYVAAGGNPAQWVRENIRTDVPQKENTK